MVGYFGYSIFTFFNLYPGAFWQEEMILLEVDDFAGSRWFNSTNITCLKYSKYWKFIESTVCDYFKLDIPSRLLVVSLVYREF